MGAAAASTRLQQLPAARRRGQRPAGPRPAGVARRSTATPPSRLGITPQAIDDTLYDAFGQRQVSTIFTQLNQYRVVLEVDARVPAAARTRSTDIYVPSADRRSQVPLERVRRTSTRATRAAGDQPPGPVPGGDDVVQPRARASLGDAVDGDRGGASASSACPPSIHDQLPGHGAGVPGLARQRAAADPRRARHRLHRARRALRELHPPDHDPVDAAVGRRRRAAGAAAVPAPTSASSRSSASSC